MMLRPNGKRGGASPQPDLPLSQRRFHQVSDSDLSQPKLPTASARVRSAATLRWDLRWRAAIRQAPTTSEPAESQDGEQGREGVSGFVGGKGEHALSFVWGSCPPSAIRPTFAEFPQLIRIGPLPNSSCGAT